MKISKNRLKICTIQTKSDKLNKMSSRVNYKIPLRVLLFIFNKWQLVIRNWAWDFMEVII